MPVELPNFSLVSSIAFEGPHRVGKGQNIDLLGTYLTDKGMPFVLLKGDGSRPGANTNPGDPESPFWRRINPQLHSPDAPKEMWNYAAYILSKEYLIWKKIYMPRMLERLGKNKGMILLDRSVLSRTMIARENIDPALWIDEVPKTLYSKPQGWKGRQLDIDEIAPDLIFDLVAPLEVLLKRLDESDSKYEFRRRNLIRRYDWYLDSLKFIPDNIKERVIMLRTDRDPNDVFTEILKHLQERGLS